MCIRDSFYTVTTKIIKINMPLSHKFFHFRVIHPLFKITYGGSFLPSSVTPSIIVVWFFIACRSKYNQFCTLLVHSNTGAWSAFAKIHIVSSSLPHIYMPHRGCPLFNTILRLWISHYCFNASDCTLPQFGTWIL